MAVDTHSRPSDPTFTERVLQRVEVVEQGRRRKEKLRYLLPVSSIVVIASSWAIALLAGTSVVRYTIEAMAWLRVVANIEQHLSGALLGPFAPLPSVVSLFLFLAAIVWVRMHQSGPTEWGP